MMAAAEVSGLEKLHEIILPDPVRWMPQFHLDITAAEHLPLFGGTVDVGANFFYYQQLQGDSGSGAQFFGDFKGRTIGIGPVVSYITKVWQHDLAAELKWLPEIDLGNRLKGDSIWFKLALAL